MKRLAIAILIATFASCGQQKADLKKDELVKCPLSLQVVSHQVDITAASVPPKLLLVVDGVPKHDECLDRGGVLDVAPIALVARFNGGVSVQVHRSNGARPSAISFQLYSKGSCQPGENPVFFFGKNNLPLEFKVDYPHGPKCGATEHARVQLIKD